MFLPWLEKDALTDGALANLQKGVLIIILVHILPNNFLVGLYHLRLCDTRLVYRDTRVRPVSCINSASRISYCVGYGSTLEYICT